MSNETRLDLREQAWRARRNKLTRDQAIRLLGPDAAPMVEAVYALAVLPEEAIVIAQEVREVFKQVRAEAAESGRVLDEWSERKAQFMNPPSVKPPSKKDPMVVWVTDTLTRIAGPSRKDP
jgi:hypothetical protein